MPAKVARVTRICKQCGMSFDILPSRVSRGLGVFCSTACNAEHSKKRVNLTCETCGKNFELPVSRTNKPGVGRFCSRSCTKRNQPKETNKERFNRFVEKAEDPDACWGWNGSFFKFGYGQIRDSRVKKQVLAHRLSYEIHVGEIPNGMCVCHKCDNPVCTNPRHLFLGTKLDNSQDMTKKGRSKRGEAHFNSVLTEDDVSVIRQLRKSGELLKNIAKRFKVSRMTVSDIIHRRTWQHIP